MNLQEIIEQCWIEADSVCNIVFYATRLSFSITDIPYDQFMAAIGDKEPQVNKNKMWQIIYDRKNDVSGNCQIMLTTVEGKVSSSVTFEPITK